MNNHFFDIPSFTEKFYTPDQTHYNFVVDGGTLHFTHPNYANFFKIHTNYLHLHKCHEFCIVIDGQGTFIHGKNRYHLSPGAIFVADPDILHEITSYQTKDLLLFHFSMEISELNHSSTMNELSSSTIHTFLNNHQNIVFDSHDLLHYLPLMNRNMTSSQPLDNPNFNVVHSFVMEVLIRLSNDIHISINDRNNANDIVIAAEDYIAKHVHRPFPVTELAQVCHISTRQLRRIIRVQYDKTINQWILDKKLNMARNYLDMQYSVKETAAICGFSDPNYFSQIFKKQFDLTPSAYKKQYIN